jgi:eukaryotic-like serine/threonine-protein kinase
MPGRGRYSPVKAACPGLRCRCWPLADNNQQQQRGTGMSKEKAVIGRYELIRSIGSGSQGSVHLARDPVLDRLVAIKVLNDADNELSKLSADGTPLEARISSKLKHANIVPIYDAGQFDGCPYLVFEYVEGTTLAERLKTNGKMSVEEAVPVIAAVLKALATAHESEILHLDLSPRNILIDNDDVPRVMDFGLAQFVNFAHETSDCVTGTLRYMAPEHFLSKPLGPWTDVFALGGTFFQMVTGQHAMKGQTVEQVQLQIISANVNFEPLQDLPHGVEFIRFLQGALERDREGRYADCGVMSEAFSIFLKETGLQGLVDSADSNHSTIEFLLRRMQRKADFPTVSRTLSDINQMTGDSSTASADKLANVILRDFALTSKLLKLVNSAFYGSRSTEITSVSQAVVFLGVEQIRMTANSLTFFGHLKSDSSQLKDALTRSFFSGLIARHLAQRAKLPRAEEAFICGMCQNLGENLVIYYFPDEYADISALKQEKNLGKMAASRGVLGVSYAELGAAVAKTWNLPRSIVDTVRGLPPGPIGKPKDEDAALRDIAIFANELCELFQSRRYDEMQSEMTFLLRQFEMSVPLERDYCVKLVNAGYEKLKQYAPIFEINVASSGYCSAVRSWIDQQLEAGQRQIASA